MCLILSARKDELLSAAEVPDNNISRLFINTRVAIKTYGQTRFVINPAAALLKSEWNGRVDNFQRKKSRDRSIHDKAGAKEGELTD